MLVSDHYFDTVYKPRGRCASLPSNSNQTVSRASEIPAVEKTLPQVRRYRSDRRLNRITFDIDPNKNAKQVLTYHKEAHDIIFQNNDSRYFTGRHYKVAD